MSATVGLNIDVILTGQDKVTSGIRSMTGEVERSTSSNVASFGKTRAGVESISNELHKLEGYAKAYIGLSQLGGAAIGIVKIADEYVGLQARLKLATTSQLEFNTANAALFAIAQQNGVPLKESLGLYSKLAPALKELGATQTQTLAMTDLVGKSLRLSGAGAAESASAMLQFSQALGSGVLRGDEFNSLMENSPRLMKAVAEGMNAPISSLRAMAEAGELTADKVVNSLLSQKSKLEEEYSSLPLTVSAAWTKLGNAVTAEVGRLDKAGGGLTGGLAKALGGVADNLDKVSAAFVATGAALATLGIAKAIEASTAYVLALQAERAAAIAVAEAEVMRVRWTYTASVASRAAAAAALVQATATGTLAGVIGTATAAIRAFVVANPFLLVAAAIGTATYAATRLFEESINGFANFQRKIKEMSASDLSQKRAALHIEILDMKNSVFSGFYEKDIRMGEDRLRMMDAQMEKQKTMVAGSGSSLAARADLSGYLNGGQSKAQQRSKDLAEETKYYQQLITQSIGNKAVLEQIEAAHKVRLEKINEKYKEKTTRVPVDRAAAQTEQAAQRYMAKIGDTTQRLLDEAAASELSNSAIGKSAEQLALAAEARYNEQIAQRAGDLAIVQGIKGREAEAALIEMQIGALGRLRDAETARPQLQATQAKLEADKKASENAAKKAADDFQRTSDRISQSLTDALMRGFESGKTFSQNLRDTTYNLFKTMVLEPQIKASVQPLADALNRIVSDFAKGIANSLSQSGSGGGVGGGIGSFISGLFNANGNAFGSSGVQAFANGGTFSNGIVNPPPPFQFAKGGGFGLGVMGEAGPEAVMPLTRTPGGQLGVRMAGAAGAAQGNITINVMVNTQSGAVDSRAQGGSGNGNTGGLQQLGNQLGNMVRDILVQEQRPGGVLA